MSVEPTFTLGAAQVGVERLLPFTSTCNASCFFCSRHQHDAHHYAPDRILAAARELAEPGGTVVITGGEPTLHPEAARLIAGVIDIARQLDARVILETNFTVVQETVVQDGLNPKQLTKLGLDAIRVFYPGAQYPGAPQTPHLAAIAEHVSIEIVVPVLRQTLPWVTQLPVWHGVQLPNLRRVILQAMDPRETTADGRKYAVHPSKLKALAFVIERQLPPHISLEVRAGLAPVEIQTGSGDSSLFSKDDGTLEEAIVRVNYRCNEACSWCWVDHEKPDVPLQSIKSELDRVRRLGSTYVTFSGGEPTLSKDLLPAIRYAKARGFNRVGLQTNAVRCKDASYCDDLVEAGMTEAFVSLHGSKPEIADAVTELRNAQVRTVAGLQNLLERGVLTRVNFVVEQRNYRDLPEFVRFFKEKFLGYGTTCVLILSFAHPINDQSSLEHIPRLKDVAPYLKEALDWALKNGVQFAGLEAQCGVPMCIMGGEMRYYPRLEAELGKSHDRDFVFLESCEQCAVRSSCIGIRKSYLAAFGADEFEPVEKIHP